MHFSVWCLVVCLAGACCGERWQWPEPAASVRIDTKVRFLERGHHDSERAGRVQADEVLEAASHTDGFYNRPEHVGRYPVRVEEHQHTLYPQQLGKGYEHDGTVDSLQHCRCVADHQCGSQQRAGRACGGGKFLCCYNEHNQVPTQNSEYFNEIEDERPSLLPGQEDRARAFPPAPGFHRNGVLVGSHGPSGSVGPQAVLTGPGGPTGHIGPAGSSVKSPGVLIGPGGPTGVVGPHGRDDAARLQHHNPDVLVGPGGPTGNIGPRDVGHSETAQRGVLVGPGGPTGIIGPRGYGQQRPVLVGPGGPTGLIGPRGYGQQRPVLVGPGGPTGLIGPRMQGFFKDFFSQQRAPRLLVGPGGPSGTIGPGRQLLVGPGGPTGRIGPQNYFV